MKKGGVDVLFSIFAYNVFYYGLGSNKKDDFW